MSLLVNIYQAINEPKLDMFCIKPYCSQTIFFFFFCLSSACLSNKPKIKAQAWLIYKQMNMNELFIELSLSCLWTVWFIYNPTKTKMCWKVGDICPLASYIEIISLVNKTLKLSSKLHISSPWGSSSVKKLEPHRLKFWLLIWRIRRKKNPRSKEFEEERRTMVREKLTGRRSHGKRRTNGWRMKKNKERSRTHRRRRWTEDRLGERSNLTFKHSSSTWIYCNSRLW